jgi:branched-chain amino acid transport system permease protein
VNVQNVQVFVVVTTAVLMILLTLIVARTRIGKAMRATSFDREAAAMMGIDVDRVIASTFFIGSLLAGAAGVMFGLLFSQIFHFMGFLAGLKGFTAAVVGGIGSIPGAMLGGLLVGLTESYAGGYLGGQWADLTVFGILIVVLLVRPSGLLGTRAIQKV